MMVENEELDAAERALGTLPRGDETSAQAMMREQWEQRLSPLNDFIDPVPPPTDMFDRIRARIDQNRTKVVALAERRARHWRTTALSAMAASIALAAWIAFQPAPAGRYIAVMTPGGTGPAIVVELDTVSGTAILRPFRHEAENDGTLEVCHVPAGGTPVSLGLADPNGDAHMPMAAAPGDTIAISLEPDGGSPTGQPTGPVLYAGVLQVAE